MAFVAVDKNGKEWIYPTKPHPEHSFWYIGGYGDCVQIPSGTIKKLIGRDLTFDDDPVELT